MSLISHRRIHWIAPVLLFAACSRQPAAVTAPSVSPSTMPAHASAPPAESTSPVITDYVREYSKSATYSEVEKDLYVGGRVLEPPPGTRAVVCLSHYEDEYKVDFPDYQPIDDGGTPPSLDWLRKQVQFIDAQRKAGHMVYVHCDAGYSRAPMVTTAYLMWEHKWPRDEALDFLKTRRQVGPNIYFMNLLADWEDELKLPAATQKDKP